MSSIDTLSVRTTHTYVGTYQHLDEWLDIGTIELLASRTIKLDLEDDICEPEQRELTLIVRPDVPTDDSSVRRALIDTYTKHDCHHEHDCCGCRSFYVEDANRIGTLDQEPGSVWRLIVGSSRNY